MNKPVCQQYLSQLSDKYIPLKKIGEGAYGEVWQCVQLETHKEVAVKTFLKEVVDRDMVMTEATIISRLDHPNIVKIGRVYENDQYIFIEMELLTGGTLEEHVDNVGPMSDS